MAQKEDAEFLVVKDLREKLFQIPLLPQDALIPKFQQVDELLYPLALRLAEALPSTRQYFTDIVHKVASGNTLGKNYFNKNDNEDEKNAKKEIFKKSELRIMAESMSLLRYMNEPKKFCHVLATAGFMRGVMEEAVEIFLENVKDYRDVLENLEKSRLAHSIDYLQYEKRKLEILTSLGLTEKTEHVLDTLIEEVECQWYEYLELREGLVSPYYRLVFKVAKKFAQTNSQTLDNFQNGIGGLLRAYSCYTQSRFAAFSVVAERWINQSILLQIKNEVNFIKLPIANWHSYQKLEKVRLLVEQKTGLEATPEQIAAEAKMAVDKVKKIYENIKLAKVLSLNVPTENEENQNEGPSWSIESLQDHRDMERELETEAEYAIVKQVAANFDEEELVIFALASGCLDLIHNDSLHSLDIEKEKIRQRGVRYGLQITFK